METRGAVRDFDKEAATWDDEPRRRELTSAIATGICRTVPLGRTWRVLEYGCGTAALGLLLAQHVREVVAADASKGMVEQVRRKLAVKPVANLTPRLLDLTREPVPSDRYDLIAMAMALHHVEDTTRLLANLASMLRDDGWLVVADLHLEDGSFHTPTTVPHNGFSPDALADVLAHSAVPMTCRWQTVHAVRKNERAYNVFLLTAQRCKSPIHLP